MLDSFPLYMFFGSKSIVKMMITNYQSLNLDLTARDRDGRTGFQLARDFQRFDVENIIKTKVPKIAFLYHV